VSFSKIILYLKKGGTKMTLTNGLLEALNINMTINCIIKVD